VKVVVVGGGPAGLMAAEVLSTAGAEVHLYDGMPSVGRKFLLAGRGGLNLTHSEAEGIFGTRFGQRSLDLAPALQAFGPAAVRVWAAGLGVPTFVGSSGRVFPAGMKAAPLLRAWLHRLRSTGVRFEALTDSLMLRGIPGVFCAGEMLDWEAPTGGYLLTACMASGRRAAEGVLAWASAGHGHASA
jgi:predicted flavoprotein YhiN